MGSAPHTPRRNTATSPAPFRIGNLCRSCGLDFASVEAFDEHRIGVHSHLATERRGGRRCRTAEELAQLGWARNQHGRWVHPRQLRKIAHRAGYPAQDDLGDRDPTRTSTTDPQKPQTSITASADNPEHKR